MHDQLKPIQIGTHIFPSNAFLAPLSGITDKSFRTIAARYGAGMVVSEMIASAALTNGHADMARRLGRPERLPNIIQLAGCEGRWMAEGAKIAEDSGADIIDINMGCPSKRVTNGYAGSALMRVPDKAQSLIESVLGATSLPVTLKMRLGWNDDCINSPEIAQDAAKAGIQMITIHGRTRQQFYKGAAKWSPVRDVVEAVDVPVVVNGDIVDIATAKRALELSGAAAVMIGRGAQGQPWLLGQVGAALHGNPVPATPALKERQNLMKEHYSLMMEEYGTALGVRCARKHLGWYMDVLALEFTIPKAARAALLTQGNALQVPALIDQLFDQLVEVAA
ncbi:tRNA dihydrouridine synthase DusB [uncultured Maritalea sp.]|jgi:tRNA-dihydrouridine synthase B|uniref:tRNA dihydrouridine synthase DusB n=1 Tax=uncultured Maritalea sp. TaxID=757249 RepID=UPI0026160735|nr:tRNA dihydrouridine synthase DusB [uncultured Maritalea sp.]